MMFVGIDVGTTRTKAMLFDPSAQQRTVEARSTPVIGTTDGDVREPDAVVEAVVACMDGLVRGLPPASRHQIAGIGVTSLSEEVVLLDEYGQSVGAMPTWYSGAGAKRAAALGLDPSCSWAKLAWAREHLDEETQRRVAGFTTLNSYVVARLSGLDGAPVDRSHASRSGFFDVRAGEWRPEVFKQTGWSATSLPSLVDTGSLAARIDANLARRLGVPESASVVFAGHDHFCGAYAVGVRDPGQIYVSAGTSEAHCLILDALPDREIPPNVGVGRFVDGDHYYLHRQLPSGHLYQHWTRLLGLDDDASRAQEDARLLAEPLGARGTVIVPGFNTDTRSTVFGLPSASGAHTILRALLEGLACAGLHVDRALVELAKSPVTGVVAGGIPALSETWRSLRSNLSVGPLSVSDENEAPALGAALLAQKAITGAEHVPSPPRDIDADPTRATEFSDLFARFEAHLSLIAALDR